MGYIIPERLLPKLPLWMRKGYVREAVKCIKPQKNSYLVFVQDNETYWRNNTQEFVLYIVESGYVVHIKDDADLAFFKLLHSEKIECVQKI